MCGIVGIVREEGARVEEHEVRRMLDRMPYRGPDGSDVYLNGSVGLGHVRLSIQDLSDLAAQPMVSHCRRFVLTYNGEVYNHAELRADLLGKGVELKSSGDTEALLEYLAAFGVAATVERVEGMFAFALWDTQERTLTLARDRHGIKPLVYSLGPSGEIRFASEMKALFDRTHEPDLTTLNAILCGLGGTWGDATVFRGIRWVGAGEVMVFRAGADPERYSFFHVNDFVDEELCQRQRQLPKEEIVRLVNENLEESIDLRLISDAPVAAFVSGGVDSSLIAALAVKRYPGLQLFHANVVGDSELEAAEHLAKGLGLELHSVDVSDRDVIDYTPLATYHYEMPMGYHNGGCVPFMRVSELAGRHGIKVVLTGEGSDEYFFGYPKIMLRPLIHHYRRVTGFLQNLLHRFPALGALLSPRQQDNVANHLRSLMFRYELEERRGAAAEAFSFVPSRKNRDFYTQTCDLVIGNVRPLLHRNDRLGMSASLESRFPFLGHALARTAMNLPHQYKLRRTRRFGDWRHPFIVDKWVVRELAHRHMTQSLARRKKFGLRSTFYKRVEIDKGLFTNGFLSHYYDLNARGITRLFETTTPYWMAQVLSLEVWGQIFCMGMSVEESRERLQRYVVPHGG